jgi:hypothetical protein
MYVCLYTYGCVLGFLGYFPLWSNSAFYPSQDRLAGQVSIQQYETTRLQGERDAAKVSESYCEKELLFLPMHCYFSPFVKSNFQIGLFFNSASAIFFQKFTYFISLFFFFPFAIKSKFLLF